MLNQPGKSLTITIADVMTREVFTVQPETSIERIIQIFTDKNFAGIPVTDKTGTLLGIITQYDLVTKGSGIHIPTLVKTLEGVNMMQPEKMVLEETLAPIKKLSVRDIMNTDPLYIRGSAPIEDAVLNFAEHHKVNPIIVVDEAKKVIGVLSRHDLIKILAMKELGRAVNSAAERGNSAKGAEGAVAGTMRGIKKEFLFMPKYGAKKWIFLGIAIFVIGLLASFLLIVKAPETGQKTAQPGTITVPLGEGATLSLKTAKTTYKVGEDIPVDMYLGVKSGGIAVSKAGINFSLNPELLFANFTQGAGSSNFFPQIEIFDIKNNYLLFVFSASSSDYKTSPGETFYLGTAIFKAIKPVQVDIAPTFSRPRTTDNSFAEEAGGTEILDAVSGVSFTAR